MAFWIGGVLGIILTLYFFGLFIDWLFGEMKKVDAQCDDRGFRYKNPPRINNGNK